MIEFFNKPMVFFDHKKHGTSFVMPNMHYHEYHELYYLVNGKTKYFIGSDLYELKPGDFIFIPKGEYHQTEYLQSSGVERILICFDDEFLGEGYSRFLTEITDNNLIRVNKDSLPLFQSIFKKIEVENQTKTKDYLLMQKLYLRQILILLCRHRQSNYVEELSGTSKLIQDAAKYIMANYSQPLSLELLADEFAISSGYFSKLFKKVTGIGVNEYINLSRISVAKELLAQKGKSVTDVAMDCGFNDSNYFAQVFKKITGVSPKKYSMQFV